VREFKITDAKKGAAFAVHVVTWAKKSVVDGLVGDAIKVCLTTPPVEDKINDSLVAFLAEKLGVSQSQLEIVAGETAQNKIISVLGLSPSEVEELLLG